MIHYYYGYGKGKTTSAIGAGMRAAGAGLSVDFVQFFKDNKSSELASVPFGIFEAPDSLPFNPDDDYLNWINSALAFIKSSKADMIILDEFSDLIPRFLSVEDIKDIICDDKEYVITGHAKVKELVDLADYVTRLEKVCHPYDNGVKARRGIEF